MPVHAPRLTAAAPLRRALLELALLLYFSRQHQDAWQELGCVLQLAEADPRAAPFDRGELDKMQLLWEKLRLLVEFES